MKGETDPDDTFAANERTAFGEARAKIDVEVDFFTGKPQGLQLPV